MAAPTFEPAAVPPSGRTVVIAGASGFMGRRFAQLFRDEGDRVVTIGRAGADVTWGDTENIVRAIDGSALLLNLAGKSVNCRYNEANKAEIFRSRLETTAELGTAVGRASTPPPVWMNASTATIYRHADDRPMTESEGDIGEGFSVDVATSWEQTFFAAARPGVRQVALRTAITLGDGSALQPLVRLARLGLGGPNIGGKTPGGNQRFSWVHLDDAYRAIRFLEQSDLDGPVNVSSPFPSTNREFTAVLRRVLGVPFGIPLYGWMLELGSRLIRTETELVLKSRWVLPERLLEAGFEFDYPHLGPALRQILHKPAA
ncbi:TIGR01777 family oxidoreductase [Schumannella sp. 10F1B-5-1]|uniref:TIGR01777 family oxidoreductase n=1 Tax=Schumannella sp. 10F1B-5-1 TaxID=2590780 RepID=UPI0011320D45|nr:TIGR01777 family oxidoreductase [Schumannella sp. 10F1B-5-1]TPW70316.1 TIGR01777 family protein [Schumannella sp. 10F1B-5-1]